MKRTTILADEELLLEAKYLATQQGKTLTQLVRDALAEYIQAHWEPRYLSLLGVADSGETDLSSRVDEILKAEIDPVEGWSPRRRRDDRPAAGPAANRPD